MSLTYQTLDGETVDLETAIDAAAKIAQNWSADE